jgi:hypothetical protein
MQKMRNVPDWLGLGAEWLCWCVVAARVVLSSVSPVLEQGGDTCRVLEDELGGPPEMMLAELR